MSECLSGPARAATSDIEERALVDGRRRRDEGSFVELIDRGGASMLRVVRSFVEGEALAEEAVREALVDLLNGQRQLRR